MACVGSKCRDSASPTQAPLDAANVPQAGAGGRCPSGNIKRRALLLLHGWPGSILEFISLIPLLNRDCDAAGNGVIFDVVAPCLPGYCFSEAPEVVGFDPIAAAEMFLMLMQRLRYAEYYVHGGDWGAIIGTAMAQIDRSTATSGPAGGPHIQVSVPTLFRHGFWSDT
jgi:pimeloyl-ACP methyl ester carboxylesterase